MKLFLIKEKCIKSIQLVIALAILLPLMGCAHPEGDSYEKHSGAHGERVELIKEYQSCMEKYAADMEKTGECKKYLRESEALK